ncbi:hypothetical protein BHE74_00001583 [Ensete ventricosum]|uniref:Uncharacterized protein n=1 Tax=Ensete ventricosum TaxID=4639 RepID=A0A445M996_ENSVE|nr:hypothetical protein BHE74_00001583 [Ensete ventricosum]RZR70807.1 hypothetical protein BHM03_00001547 [Ensete ventricosum]
MNPMTTQAFMGAQAAPWIDAVVDSFVSEGRKAEKEQYGGTGNRILANLTQEPTTTPGGMVYLEQPYFASEAVDLPELELLIHC